MEKNIALILFCIGFVKSVNATDDLRDDDFLCVNLGEIEARNPSVVERSLPIPYEGLPNPDRSLDSTIRTIEDFLKDTDTRLDRQRLLYSSTELYTTLEDHFVEIQEMFSVLKNDHEELLKQDGYLIPLCEPNKQTMNRVRKMSASLKEKVETATLKINTFEKELSRIIEGAEEK